MKITLKTFVVAGFLLGGSILVSAQTKEERVLITSGYDLNASTILSERLSSEFYTNKAKAVAMAASKGWPLQMDKDDAIIRLMGVTEEGAPLYYTTFNAGSVLTSRANHIQPGGSLGLNLTGSGMSVGVWDGEYPRTTHVDFTTRFAVQDGSGANFENHPTHVLGTIMGSGQNNTDARGVAYEAFGLVNNFANDSGEMAEQASYGLLLSNHSYGFIISGLPAYFAGAYTSKSKDVDDIIYNNRFYQPVVAAGNDGNGNYDRLTGMSTSKNTVVVANINGVNSYTGSSSVVIAGSSSWGPTDDNRVKPDISSKGQNVFSATSVSNNSYGNLSGTSMAAPGVTGVFVLLQQYYSQLNPNIYMWSSTIRGLMAHSADEAGAFDGPDSKFGWGLINAKKSAETIQKKGTQSLMNQSILLPATTYTKQVMALGNEPLIVTLAWTDPSGNVSNGSLNNPTPVLVNNLDIRVTKDGETFFPWKLGSSLSSAAVQGDNNVDNIEKVEINQPSGVYTITVSHKGSTLVNRRAGSIPSQEYSLLVSGIDVTANLGVNTLEKEQFSVWPNPASDILNISVPTFQENTFVSVYDIQGREIIANKLLTESISKISLDALSKGIYLVKVYNNSFNTTKKVIVK
jgi:serine protease AprX